LLLIVSGLFINVGHSIGQDLRLEISVPKYEIGAQEPVNLTLKLINYSSRPYYVSSALQLGAVGIGHEFGGYQLEISKTGTTGFVAVPGIASDGIPPRNLSSGDFILQNQLVLLLEGVFVGKTFASNWYGLTLQEPGRYSVRVTYRSYGKDEMIPNDLRFPIFRTPLVSNVIDLEIKP
jgi:hypothetical protein